MSIKDKVKIQRRNALKFALIGAVGLCASGSINSYAAISENELDKERVQNPDTNRRLVKDGLKPGAQQRAYPDVWKGGAAKGKNIKNPKDLAPGQRAYIDMYTKKGEKPKKLAPGQRAYIDMYTKKGEKPKLSKPNWPGALQKTKPVK